MKTIICVQLIHTNVEKSPKKKSFEPETMGQHPDQERWCRDPCQATQAPALIGETWTPSGEVRPAASCFGGGKCDRLKPAVCYSCW